MTMSLVKRSVKGVPLSAAEHDANLSWIDERTAYTPEDFGAVGDGLSHQVSEWLIGGARDRGYANLTAIKVDYPHVIALTDEIDWAALQKCADVIYASDTFPSLNASCALIQMHGSYMINRTVTWNVSTIRIEGPFRPHKAPIGIGHGVKYNGVDGTVDTPIAMFDFWTFDEFGAPPPGRESSGSLGGVAVDIQRMVFYGKAGSMTGAPSASGYISGIRIRQAAFVHIESCSFSGTLWDGIWFTGPQLFVRIIFNMFYGIMRDAVAITTGHNDFATTIWIYNNEFGLVGRYCIAGNFFGSVEAKPIIRDNSYEASYQSYFVTHPEWFVHGVVSPVVLLNAGCLDFQSNRTEATSDIEPGFWADLHIVDSITGSIRDNTMRNIVFSANKASARENTALAAYRASKGYSDLTDLRFFNTGIVADATDGSYDMVIDGNNNLYRIFVLDTKGFAGSGRHRLSGNSGFLQFRNIPLVSGIAAPRATAVTPLISLSSNWTIQGVALLTLNLFAQIGHYNTATMNGDYEVRSASAYGTWVANTAYTINTLRAPTVDNGFLYMCSVAGTSHATTQPTWPTIIGNTVTDGTVTWMCVAATMDTDNAVEWRENGKRRRLGTAAPTIGNWSQGDIIMNRNPSASGKIGWVCTAAGTPGTWKLFGAIDA